MADPSFNPNTGSAAVAPREAQAGTADTSARKRKRITWDGITAAPPPAPEVGAASQSTLVPPAAPHHDEYAPTAGLPATVVATHDVAAVELSAWLEAAATATGDHAAGTSISLEGTNLVATPSPAIWVAEDRDYTDIAIPAGAADQSQPPNTTPPATPNDLTTATLTVAAPANVLAIPTAPTTPLATSATAVTASDMEAQLAALTAQREQAEARRRAAEEDERRLAGEEAELRRRAEQARQQQERLQALKAKRESLQEQLERDTEAVQREQEQMVRIEQELASLQNLTPFADPVLAHSRLLVAIERGSNNVWPQSYHPPTWPNPAEPTFAASVSHTQPLITQDWQAPWPAATPTAAPSSGPSVWLLRGSIIASVGTAALLAVALVIAILYIGVFQDKEQTATGMVLMDTAGPAATAIPPAAVRATTTPLRQAVTGSTPTVRATSPTTIRPTVTSIPPTIATAIPTATTAPSTATLPSPTMTAAPSSPPATPTMQISTQAVVTTTPLLVADADGRIPTGARAAPTPTTPPQHQPQSEMIGIAFPAIGVDSAVVTVTPIAGSDGNYYWGVDATRVGLQTPSIGCGEVGNIVVNGHNWVTRGVFREIGRLQRDDQLASLNRTAITCRTTDGSSYTYRVIAYGLYAPDDNSFDQLLPREQRTLTLYTCTNNGKQRIVLVARLEI